MCFVCRQPFCRATEPICGHNGETYSSVCAAYSDRVAVDYYGPCQAVGVLSEYSSVTECAAVKCPSLSATECKPIVPPGRPAVFGVGLERLPKPPPGSESLGKRADSFT